MLYIINHNMFIYIKRLTSFGRHLNLMAMAFMLVIPFTARFVAFTAFHKDSEKHRWGL